MSAEKEPDKPLKQSLPVEAPPIEAPSITHPDPDYVEIKYPKDPIEIGQVVVDGNIQPVWVDPKDFIRTGEQNDELKVNIDNSKLQAAVDLAVRETAARIETWLSGICEKIMPVKVFTGSDETKSAWLKEHNLHMEEHVHGDGRKIILKEGSVPISEFCVSLRGVVRS